MFWLANFSANIIFMLQHDDDDDGSYHIYKTIGTFQTKIYYL